MAQVLWSQDFFARGELSPLMYSRVTLNAYYQGLKRAKNVICYPQGSAGKRFGTIYLNEINGVTNYRQIYFKAFQYLNECCYLLVFRENNIDIYLEGELIANVTGTGIMADEVQLIDDTVLENRFRVTTGIYPPKDLRRGALPANAITGALSNALTITNALPLNGFYPARFTTASSLPITVPQIHTNKTYFVRAVTTTSVKIYSSAQDAKANINAYTVITGGVSASLIVLNAWSFANVSFSNLPVFDFTGGYDTSTFTPAAQTGYSILLTRSSGTFNFTANYIGGVFVGNGGVARIVAVNGTNLADLDIIQPFNSTAAIPGSQVLIAEPAWSNTHGWPRKCSSFQNRAFFANTETLSNGLWASVINDFDDFNDIETDDDNAISWFPTSDTVNYIQFIVPYRSLTIHTNSGVYSTPLSVETAITPKNFSLSLQDSTPAESVQPRGIDNQIIVLSGNDAHSLLWDGFNNAYTSNIISISNEQLIRTPIDEAAYVDLRRAGSRYMFIVNQDGTLAIYQTLISENVSGFTPAELEQSYGNAYFRWVTSNFDGRAWFVTERELAVAASPVAISNFSSDSFEAIGSNFATDAVTACMFSATTSLPQTSPQIDSVTFYWAIGVDANNFKVYTNQADALADENAIIVSSVGVGASVIPYPLQTKLLIEQLSFDVFMDCCGLYPAQPGDAPTSTITGQTRFNAQNILMQGDGFGYEDDVVNGEVVFEAHGVETEVSEAQYGFPINVEITPLPLSIAMANPKSSNLIDTKHIRFVTFLFADTVGGTITTGNRITPITLKTLNQTIPGEAPIPATGSFEMSIFGGWNDFTYNSFTINHREPFDMKLTGIFYKVDA
jgi:hypothetical protein